MEKSGKLAKTVSIVTSVVALAASTYIPEARAQVVVSGASNPFPNQIGESVSLWPTGQDAKDNSKRLTPPPADQGTTISSSGTAAHGKADTSGKEKKDEEKSKQGEGAETATKRTANGQTIFEMTKDGKKYEYYYINGQKGDFISQYDSSSGSFKWTTKDAMLGNVQGTGLKEVGSIQLQDGRLTKMYQTPGQSGQYVFNNGNSWVGSKSMGDGAVYQKLNASTYEGPMLTENKNFFSTKPPPNVTYELPNPTYIRAPMDLAVQGVGSVGGGVLDPFSVDVNAMPWTGGASPYTALVEYSSQCSSGQCPAVRARRWP